ncbi:putative RDD family membrane protein YckC [Blastomonas natatoria]|uniref:Putative RDD family membrane protein YckC n=1 Tax=Blastomonas natatoria TaxID=34015 RepID=A0A2V3V2F5_9SPHN|nr:RDD family protein [Blastomonas natatoria]PXW75101.1 putative RDD family membrane protein YckC [Blastomonas natatoria]
MARAADLGRTHGADPRLRRTLVTPEGVALDVQVAPASARVGALFIDLAALFGLFLAFVITVLLIVWAYQRAGLPRMSDGVLGFLAILFIIGTFLARNAYFLFFELGQRAATWGKRSIGIRVAARDGGRLTAEAVIARNLLRDIEMFLPLMFMTSGGVQGTLSEFAAWSGIAWVGIFLLFPLLNKDRLRCGDLIAGTWVIQTPKAMLGSVVATGAPVNAAVAALPADRYRFEDEELSVYGEYELQMLEQVLRKANPDAMTTVAGTICGKIGWTPPIGDEQAFLEAYYTQLRARLERGMRFGQRRADKNS